MGNYSHCPTLDSKYLAGRIHLQPAINSKEWASLKCLAIYKIKPPSAGGFVYYSCGLSSFFDLAKSAFSIGIAEKSWNLCCWHVNLGFLWKVTGQNQV